MENSREIVHAETQHEAALMSEETGLLEELPYGCPSPSDHHNDDPFATCTVSITYSYEGPAEKIDHLHNDVHLMTKPSPKVHLYGDIDDLNPLEGDAVHPRYIQPTPSHQKPISLPAPSQCNSPAVPVNIVDTWLSTLTTLLTRTCLRHLIARTITEDFHSATKIPPLFQGRVVKAPGSQRRNLAVSIAGKNGPQNQEWAYHTRN